MARTAIVIGSGFGGLALAVRLQSAGIETTLVEARDKPGGRAYVWEDEGFVFDAGPTVVTDPGCLDELFALTGRKTADYVDLMPVAPFYRLIWEDGYVFDYSNDDEKLMAQIAAKNPADAEGYRQFMKFSEGVYQEGYLKLGTESFCDFRSMLEAAPSLLRYEAFRSVYGIVSRYIKDPQLREAFSFHTLLVGGNPFNTSSVYALIHALEKKGGVWFPRGGTNALIRGLLKLFTDLGGKSIIGTGVTAIEATNNVTGVTLADGRVLKADAVASNGDVVHTYKDLLGAHPRGRKMAKAMMRKSFSPSLFVVYFGLKGTYPDIKHHSIIFGPRYRELLKDIYSTGIVADDFSLYLHHPTASDPAMAPEGCSTFYVLSPVPHLGKFAGDWDKVGPVYADRILDYLEERGIVPDLKANLVTKRMFTPANFKTELKAHLGSAFSLEPVLWQSAYFRTHNRDDELKNLYFVGAGTHPGAGIPGVVGSAKATAKLMLADLGARYPDPRAWPSNAGPMLAAAQ